MIESKTVIMIAHRLYTIISADQILFLKDGQIAERGTHNELISINGYYNKFWTMQEENRTWKF